MSHTNLRLGSNWPHDEWPEFVDVGHDGASDSKIYVPERTCHVVKHLDGDNTDPDEFYLSCHHSCAAFSSDPPSYCPECGARVVG